jgi:Tol biopolymer transport system component
MNSRYRYAVLVVASAVVAAAAASGVRSQSRVIVTLGSYDFGDIAPSVDGKFILVAVDSALLKVDMATRSVSTVVLGQFFDLALSPAGNRIAFQRWTNDVPAVWSARFDATRGTVDSITRIADSAWAPVFSRDGKWIALTHRFGATDSLRVITTSGDRRVVPATGGTNLIAAGWSRDGRAVYYTANLGGPNNHAIYKVDLSTGITRTVIERNFEPRVRVSLDERYLLYRPSSEAYALATVSGTHVADVDVERRGFGREVGDPQWLPGTSSLVFSSRDEPRALIAYAFDGTTSTTLSDSAAFTVSPAVSLDGKWLAAITAGPEKPRILIRPMVGGEARRIDVGAPIAQISPNLFLHWSPDGRYLAVPMGNVDALGGHVNPGGIAVVDTRAGSVRRFATEGTVGRFIWSPDSRAIRYSRSYDSAAGPHRPIEIRETTFDGKDRLVQALSQCCGGATFLDFEHSYTKADGQLTDLRTGTHRTVIDPANLPLPDPGNVIPMACFTLDGKYAAMPTSATGRGPYNRVMIVSMESGERRIIDAGVTRTNPNSIFCHPDSKHVVMTGFDSARAHQAVSVSIDGSSRRVIGEVNRDVSGMVHMTISPDGKWLITSRTLPARPLQLVAQDAVPGVPR